MSESNARIGRAYPIDPRSAIGVLNISSLRVTKTDIANYKQAVDSVRSALSPRRSHLYDLYYSIILDAHLQSVLMKRITAITNHKVKFIDAQKNGEPNETVEHEILNSPWFYKLLEIIMETRAFGHSLIEFLQVKGKISDVALIPRHNVHPEYQYFSWQYNQPPPSDGFNYATDPTYSKFLLEIGGMKDYGLLLYAAPWIIYKRSGMADWAQFAEIFGMPFREGRYDPYDDNNRKLLIEGLENMGGAAYAAIPKGAEITFHETSKTGTSELYKDLVSVCDEQVSKLFLGGTMTVENGSSRSQAEVHAKGEDDINLADMIWIEHILNGPFKEKMIGLGYNIPEGRFSFPESSTIPLKDRITIDVAVSKLVPMPVDYFYKTYSIEKPDGAVEVTGGPAPAPAEPPVDPMNERAVKPGEKKKA